MDGVGWFDHGGARGVKYDVTLAAIPAVFLLSYQGAAANLAGGTAALMVAATASGLLIVAALFFDPPIDASV